MSAGFIAVCALAFVTSVTATVHFCRTMGGGMKMPGGWTMSMMWMQMPGRTWFGSAVEFSVIWLAMMVPSALPTFLRTGRQWASLCYMAIGYFAIWLAIGVGIYLLGVVFAAFTMRSESLSRAVPWFLSSSLIAAGVFQFTRWKMIHLSRCRSQFGCAFSCAQQKTSFRLGCAQGLACCVCCISPMAILLALGMMNLFLMIGVAIVIAAEKILSRPEIVARVVGVAAIVLGFAEFTAHFHSS